MKTLFIYVMFLILIYAKIVKYINLCLTGKLPDHLQCQGSLPRFFFSTEAAGNQYFHTVVCASFTLLQTDFTLPKEY